MDDNQQKARKSKKPAPLKGSRGRTKRFAAKADAPSIYGYRNYKSFLQDWIEYLKEVDEDFSIRKLSKAAGLSSGYFPNLFNGVFCLSEEALAGLEPHLHLPANDLSYLRLLRVVAESLDHEERLAALRKIQRFSGFKLTHEGETQAHQYFSKWYYTAIRELVETKGFRLEPQWIQDRLTGYVSLRDIRAAIKFLVENGYIDLSDPERPKQVGDVIWSQGDFFKIILHQFHHEMLDLQVKSFAEIEREHRSTRSFTMPMEIESFEKVRKIIEEALEKVRNVAVEESKKGKSNSVVQVNFGAFPLSLEPDARKGVEVTRRRRRQSKKSGSKEDENGGSD